MLVFQSAFLKALGWSLVDSVWQMGILWLAYICLTASGKRFDAGRRHSLALLSMFAGSVWFIAELVFNLANPDQIAFSAARASILFEFKQFAASMEAALPLLSVLYLAVSVLLFLQLIRQYRQTRSLAMRGLHKVDAELRIFTRQMASRMHLVRKIEVWLSEYIDSPLTIGFWKPLILLPVSAVSQLSTEQAEAIILHELHHIRRNDYLVNLVVAFSTVVLFFNPFARFLSIAIRNEREHSCDDLVLQFQYKPAQYAAALLILETSRGPLNLVRVQATGTHRPYLLQRVRRILTGEPAATPVSHRMIGVFISFLLIGFLGWHGPASRLTEAMIPSMADGFVRMEMKEEALIDRLKPDERLLVDIQTNPAESAVLPLVPDAADNHVSEQHYAESPEYLGEVQPDFVSNEVTRDYSLQSPLAMMEVSDPNAIHPYIPSSTLDYSVIEDTTIPRLILQSLDELKASDAKEKAMLALKEVNWLELERSLRQHGKSMDIVALQKEIKKAMADVDWKKINAEAELANAELHEQNNQLQDELRRYQLERSRKAQELSEIRQKLILDRLENSATSQRRERKIVVL